MRRSQGVFDEGIRNCSAHNCGLIPFERQVFVEHVCGDGDVMIDGEGRDRGGTKLSLVDVSCILRIIKKGVMMAAMKMEPEDDVLAVQPFDDIDMEEANPLADEGRLMNALACGTTVPSMDLSCDLKSEIKMEETAEPSTFLAVKCGSEEEIFVENKLEIKEEECEVPTERPIPHGENVPVPIPPYTWQEESESDITSSNDVQPSTPREDVYIPDEERKEKPHLITWVELNDLIRDDLYLTNQLAEILGSRLQELKVLDKDANVSVFRNINKDLLPFFMVTDSGVCTCSDVNGLIKFLLRYFTTLYQHLGYLASE
ncbi:hypothetical protein ANN_27640 [Periplaneta americana]|uniref:Uncharacterized protein n=1 Tax=Periplaneta americana TaxID=6978 RepID=A0ABQ8RWA2_PERAM|nr:hypothetical protein ANN_27640 [Periplaneta americana]